MKENIRNKGMSSKFSSPNIEIVDDSDDNEITINDNASSSSNDTAIPQIVESESDTESINIKSKIKGSTKKKQHKKLPTFDPDEFKFFSNTKKSKPIVEKKPEQDNDSESEKSDESDEDNESDDISVSQDDSASQCSSVSDASVEKKPKLTKKQKEQRKQELLIKLIALEKKGVALTKNYSLKSSLEDIEFEYETQRRSAEMEASVHFQQKILMATVTGVEFLNKKFDPIGAKLDGWSESVMDNINDYEEIFRKLYEKYSDRASMPPELQLLVTLVGSGFMFHLTQSLFKSSLPGLGDALKSNPDIMKNIMGAMGQAMNNAQGNNVLPNNEQLQQEREMAIKQQLQEQNYQQNNQQIKQQNMSGPSVNLSNLLNKYQDGPGLPKVQQSMKINAPDPEDDRISIASSDSNISEIKNIPLTTLNKGRGKGGTGKGRGRTIKIS